MTFIFQGLGTNERTLIEVLMTRTNAQLNEMVQEYDQSTSDICYYIYLYIVLIINFTTLDIPYGNFLRML